MKKQNFAVPLQLLLDRYHKDIAWLETLCGVNEGDIEKMIYNGKTTLAELEKTLLRGKIILLVGIYGWSEPNKNSLRTWFLKNYFQVNRCAALRIQDVTNNKNAPKCWYEKDDITLKELESLRRYYKMHLVWKFNGLNGIEDNIGYKPCSNMYKTVSQRIEEQYNLMLEKKGQAKKEEKQIETPITPEIQPEEKIHNVVKEDDINAQSVAARLVMNKEIYEQIQDIASKNKTSAGEEINGLLKKARNYPHVIYYTKKYRGRESVNRRIVLDLDVYNELEQFAKEKKMTRSMVINNRLAAALHVREKYGDGKKNVAETNSAPVGLAQVDVNVSAVQEQSKPSAPKKQFRRFVQKKSPETGSGKTFLTWLQTKPEDVRKPLLDVIEKSGLQHLLDGRYGVDTINAVKKLELPGDRALVDLSLELRNDVKAGKVLFVSTEEPDYDLRPTIHMNQVLVGSYGCMKEVANLLVSNYKMHDMELDEPFFTQEKEPREILAVEAFRKDDNSDPVLKLKYRHKRFFNMVVSVDEMKVASPDIISIENWYKLAAKAHAHNEACSKNRLKETTGKLFLEAISTYDDFRKTLKKVVSNIFLEAQGTSLLDDLTIIGENDSYILSEPKYENGLLTLRILHDDKDERVGVDDLPTDTIMVLLTNMKEKVA